MCGGPPESTTLSDFPMSSGTVEALLDKVQSFAPSVAGDTFSLIVPETLTFRGQPLAHDVAMAIVVDALVAKGPFPDGFVAGVGIRDYHYRYER
jgi:hypothetical protein